MSISKLTRFWIFAIKYVLSLDNFHRYYFHCHDSTTLVPGIIAKITRPAAFLIYDSHESAIDSIKENFGFILTLFTYIQEIISFIFVGMIFTVSPLQKQVLEFRYKKLLPPVNLLRNLPLRSELEEIELGYGKELIEGLKIDQKSQLVIIYATYIGVHRGIPELISSWKNIGRKDLVILLAGDGPLRGYVEAEISSLSNFHYIGYLDAPKYYSLMKNCDLGLSLIDPTSNLNKKIGFPNKMTEYLACEVVPLSTRLLNFNKEFQQGLAIPIESITEDDLLTTFQNIDFAKMEEKRLRRKNQIISHYLWEKDLPSLIAGYGLNS